MTNRSAPAGGRRRDSTRGVVAPDPPSLQTLLSEEWAHHDHAVRDVAVLEANTRAMAEPGRIVILNGPPRAGKSSIVEVIQSTFDGPWMNLGVDVFARGVTPERFQPGMGLRPGGERPDIEVLIPALFGALYDSIAAHSRHGLNVVVDIEHHEGYSQPLGLLADGARRIAGLPVLFVGVRCPIDVVTHRRDATWPGWRDGLALIETPYGELPEVVLRWERHVHAHEYDLEVDTSTLTSEECADRIRGRLDGELGGSVLQRLAAATP